MRTFRQASRKIMGIHTGKQEVVPTGKQEVVQTVKQEVVQTGK
jgi:hypothetical protein